MTNETIDINNDPRLAEGVWIIGPDGTLVPDYDATFPTINEGEVVHGVVVRVDKDKGGVRWGVEYDGPEHTPSATQHIGSEAALPDTDRNVP